MKKRKFIRKCISLSLVVIMLAIPTLSCASMFYTPNLTDYMKDTNTGYSSMLGSNSNFGYGNLMGSNSGFGSNTMMGSNSGFGFDATMGSNSGFSNYDKSEYSEYYSKQDFSEIFNKIDSLEEVPTDAKTETSLNDVKDLLQNVDPDLPVSESRVDIIEKVTEIRDNNKESDFTNIISNLVINEAIAANPNDTTSALLSSIKGGLGNLIGGGVSLTSLKPDIVVKDMVATTAGKKVGNDFKVKLAGNIYFAEKDSSGKPTSDKWVVLVHGFMMNGQAIADALGEMYLERGINVLAPDLRGFGDSKGSVAMGYLESLDIWDWLTYLNENYDCEEIFVHGVSLGGATTVFISGLEVDGKTMKDQNVIGLVEDCGYASMTGIITDMISFGQGENFLTTLLGDLIKTLIIDLVGVGLNDNNFDTLQNALNSLNNSTLPLLIVHGTGDTTVPSSNSDKIYDAAMKNKNIPYVQRYLAKDGPHAFITLGMNKGEYEAHLEHFIDVAEDIVDGKVVAKEGNYSPTKVEETSILGVLISAVKLVKNIIF